MGNDHKSAPEAVDELDLMVCVLVEVRSFSALIDVDFDGVAGVGGVQMQTVRIATDNPSASPCRRCVRAFASGDFGEVKQWSVWYDGARNWQPVFMQMRLGKSAEWVLTLSLNS